MQDKITCLSGPYHRKFRAVGSAENIKGFFGILAMMGKQTKDDSFVVSFEPEGIKARTMDVSHIMLADMQFPSTTFDEYECFRAFDLRFDAVNVKNVFKNVAKGSTVTLEYDEGTKIFSFDTLDMIGDQIVRKRSKIKDMDIHDSKIEEGKGKVPLPKLTFTVKFTLPVKVYRKVVKYFRDIGSEYISFLANKDGSVQFLTDIALTAKEKKLQELDGQITIQNLVAEVKKETGNEEGDKPQQAKYSMDYLDAIAKMIPQDSKSLLIQYQRVFPVKVTIKSDFVADLYIAPRIDKDEDAKDYAKKKEQLNVKAQ